VYKSELIKIVDNHLDFSEHLMEIIFNASDLALNIAQKL